MMSRIMIALVFWAISVSADSPEIHRTKKSGALSRIVAAAERTGTPFRSFADGNTSYELQRAEYVGRCDAPFGTVHVARLFYLRSEINNSKSPVRGQTIIVFLDREFVIRIHWRVDYTLGQLSVRGSKLLIDGDELFDYAQPAVSDTLAVDGAVQVIPRWK